MDEKTNNRTTVYEKIKISAFGRDLIIAILSAVFLALVIYAGLR